jgi:hypothetical protein
MTNNSISQVESFLLNFVSLPFDNRERRNALAHTHTKIARAQVYKQAAGESGKRHVPNYMRTQQRQLQKVSERQGLLAFACAPGPPRQRGKGRQAGDGRGVSQLLYIKSLLRTF